MKFSSTQTTDVKPSSTDLTCRKLSEQERVQIRKMKEIIREFAIEPEKLKPVMEQDPVLANEIMQGLEALKC